MYTPRPLQPFRDNTSVEWRRCLSNNLTPISACSVENCTTILPHCANKTCYLLSTRGLLITYLSSRSPRDVALLTWTFNLLASCRSPKDRRRCRINCLPCDASNKSTASTFSKTSQQVRHDPIFIYSRSDLLDSHSDALMRPMYSRNIP